jgi:4-amino-4-deoxy-L-arabinose transferase-like glycosyltransferase
MFSFRTEKKWVKISLAIILVIYLSISITSIFIYGNYFLLGDIEKMDNNDDVKYVRSAVTLLDKGILTYKDVDKPTVFIMPGITFTLAPFIKIFGIFGGMTAFRIFQALLQALSLILLFLISRKIFNSNVGIAACIIDVLYIPEIYNSGVILTEVVFKFFLLLLTYITVYALQTKSVKYYAAGGLVLGLSCLYRPTIAMYPVVILVMWIIMRYKLKDMLKLGLITASVFVIVMSPWWVRNYVAFGKFIPLSQSSGNPFLQGTYYKYDQKGEYTPPVRELTGDEMEDDKTQTETGLYRLKLKFKEEPLKYIYWYSLGKIYYLWIYPYYMKGILWVSMLNARIVHYFIIVSGVLGWIIGIRRKDIVSLLLPLTVLYFTLVHLPYFTYSRYIYPAIPLMIIFSGYAAVCLYNIIKIKMSRKEVMKFVHR